mmetsp:Transcript_31175/g.36727  ORF Transcript_31175/g.36727 Transcript_31175/m.36727 type:complete len:610 (-) Transcript_31175:125-1954(-)
MSNDDNELNSMEVLPKIVGNDSPEVNTHDAEEVFEIEDTSEVFHEEPPEVELGLPEIAPPSEVSSKRRVKTEEEKIRERQIRDLQREKNKEKRLIRMAHANELQAIKDELTKHEKATAARQYENIGVALPTVNFSKETVSSQSKTPTQIVSRESLVMMPEPGQECFICKVRQGGCPLCFDFPVWVHRSTNTSNVEYVTPLQPRDYAFAPGEDPGVAVVQAGGQRIRPPLHTNLTTHSAIAHCRALYKSFTKFNIKTVPAGNTVSVSLDANQSYVDELYDAFRSNSAQTERVHLYLPTEAGIFSLCNQDEQETELLRANINAFELLSTYNIGQSKIGPVKNSSVSILNYPWYSEVEASDAFKRRAKPAFDTVERYIRSCFGREEIKPLTSILYTTKGPMCTLPETTSLPGRDRVQIRLAPVLKGEQALSEHVEALEEAEDIKSTKAGIEAMETKRKAVCLRGGREATIQAAIKAIDDEVEELAGVYDYKKSVVEDLREKLDGINLEMSNLDRVILTSAKQKIKKPSDLKMLKVMQSRFEKEDQSRFAAEQALRVAIKDAVDTHAQKEKVFAKRKAVEDKLFKMRASTALKVTDTADTRRTTRTMRSIHSS